MQPDDLSSDLSGAVCGLAGLGAKQSRGMIRCQALQVLLDLTQWGKDGHHSKTEYCRSQHSAHRSNAQQDARARLYQEQQKPGLHHQRKDNRACAQSGKLADCRPLSPPTPQALGKTGYAHATSLGSAEPKTRFNYWLKSQYLVNRWLTQR